jgi:hypothetical protein
VCSGLGFSSFFFARRWIIIFHAPRENGIFASENSSREIKSPPCSGKSQFMALEAMNNFRVQQTGFSMPRQGEN